jgi:hypothetical protein
MDNTSRNLTPNPSAGPTSQPCDVPPNVKTRSALDKRGINGVAPGKNPRMLLLSAADNCLIVWAPIPAGTQLRFGADDLVVTHAMTRGLTIARHGLHQGDKVVRCGIIIGMAACDIAAGERLHSRNLAKGNGARALRRPKRVARHSGQVWHSSHGCSDPH